MKDHRINHEMLDVIMAHIEGLVAVGSPLWRQDLWSCSTDCGTAYCFAGWTAALSGRGFVKQDFLQDSGCWQIDGRHVAGWAQHELGLTAAERIVLFDGDNTIEDLRRIVFKLHAKEGYIAAS